MSEPHRIKPSACPWCGKLHDCASAVDGSTDPPRAGDVTVCIACASPLVFAADLSLRKATREEERRMNRNPTFALASRVIRNLERRRP
jgi:hypothetical protein